LTLSLLPMRLYLLSGLVFHKVIWEVMKRRDGAVPARTINAKTRLLSAIKLAVLAGIFAQVLGWEILPISYGGAVVQYLRPLGLAVYTIGLLTAITARTQLGQNWSDIEKSYVKDDHALVAHGLYRYIRHPIYTGDLLLLFGLELALQSWAVAGVAAVAIYVRQQAVREERNLRQTLPGYSRYCSSTGRFVPFLRV
jgi:protein-S-isoprenylcysteine O-methyltransferase Ste14